MPGFDGTGPAGMGPMTGGARGWCEPYDAPYASYGPYRPPYPVPVGAYAMGRGFRGRGRGPGLGRGWGRRRGRGW
jgi:hypothetical protein